MPASLSDLKDVVEDDAEFENLKGSTSSSSVTSTGTGGGGKRWLGGALIGRPILWREGWRITTRGDTGGGDDGDDREKVAELEAERSSCRKFGKRYIAAASVIPRARMGGRGAEKISGWLSLFLSVNVTDELDLIIPGGNSSSFERFVL